MKLALLAVLVAVAHLLGLEWFARQADAISGLTLMTPPMYTRMLRPVTPPPVVASAQPAPLPVPRARVAPPPKPAASSPEELERERQRTRERALERMRELEREEELALERERERLRAEEAERAAIQAAETAASAPQQVASAPEPAASAPLAAASAPAEASLDHWPADTRLSYRLGGEYRSGPLFGDARVQWQREGGKYQVRLDVKIQVFGTQVLTSQGEVTPNGLVPREYEELGRKRRTAKLGEQVVVLDNGTTVPRPAGVQDTASQFVELAQRFATGKETLEVGRSVTVWLARPGGVDKWIYDVVERETLRLPRLGDIEAFHLKPRTIDKPRGNITAEMWFAPSLQYLPVRIKVIMGSEAYLDLTVDRIEQR